MGLLEPPGASWPRKGTFQGKNTADFFQKLPYAHAETPVAISAYPLTAEG